MHSAFMRLAPKINPFAFPIVLSNTTVMRPFILCSLAVLACFVVFSAPQSFAQANGDQSGKPNFNGTWKLDRKSSASLDPLMNGIGTGFLERKYANSAGLKATFHQTDSLLTVATRGPGFSLDETLYLDGRTMPSSQELLGATSINITTAWASNSELVERRRIKSRRGKDGELTIRRHLINAGKTLVVVFTLKLDAEPNTISVRQLWQKA